MLSMNAPTVPTFAPVDILKAADAAVARLEALGFNTREVCLQKNTIQLDGSLYSDSRKRFCLVARFRKAGGGQTVAGYVTGRALTGDKQEFKQHAHTHTGALVFAIDELGL